MYFTYVLAGMAVLCGQGTTFTYEYEWRTLDYDQFTSNRPKSLHGSMATTGSSKSYSCIHFDCLARNSNQQLYSQYTDENWSKRCMFAVNQTTYLQPCNNETNRCVYLQGTRNGICMDFFEINNITALLPGDSCPVEWYDRKRQKCQWGTFRCVDGVCAGVDNGQACSRQEDCKPKSYCHHNRTCTPELPIGQECVGDFECPRNALCTLNSDRTSSVCTEYFSLKAGEGAAPNFAGSAIIGDEWTEMLCQSGAIHPNTGKCIDAPTSTNLGKVCESDTDCTTSQAGVFAKCQCYMGREKSKKCGPVRGDPEGQAEFQAFKNYIKATSQYRREHEVNPEDSNSWSSYSEYRCKRVQFRAKYALEAINDLDCVKTEQEGYRTLLKDLPFFTEFSVYCWAQTTALAVWFLLFSIVAQV